MNSHWSFSTRRTVTAILTSWLLSGASPATAQTAAWQPVNPAPAVMAQIAIGPSGSGIVYIGTFGGGVLKSRDDGRSFQPSNNGLNDPSVSAMTAHPTDIDHLYVGTFSGGIYRTTNGGANWTLVTVAATPSPIFAIAIDPVRPSTIYVGSFGSPLLRKSTDAGATWTDANRGLPSGAPVWTIQIDPRNPDVLFAGTGGGGAFKSINGGATWTPLSVASTVFALAIDPQESDTIYAGTDGGGVYRSFDGGQHFAREISPGNGRVLSLALDRARRGAVYAGTLGGGVAVSLDFAQTFTATSLGRGFALALSINDRGEVYAGTNSAGVFRSGSYGVVWSPVAADALSEIKAQNIYGLTIDPTNPARLLAATNQSGMFETADAGRTWQEASTGLTSRSPRRPAFDPSDGTRVYAGSLPGGGLFVSSDRGRTWTSRVFGAPNIYVWALGVASDRTVYAGTVGEGLWRSSDLGASFTRVAGTPFTDVRSVVPDPSDSRRIVSGGPQGFYRSIDGGTTWSQSLTAFTNNIVFDPRNPGVVYATTQTTGVQRSTDGGATFTPINTGLTNLRTSRAAGVVFDPRDSQILYIGTEGGGVFKSRNGGASWLGINQGLANLNVYSLEIDPQNPDVLYAGGSTGVFKTVTGGEPVVGPRTEPR